MEQVDFYILKQSNMRDARIFVCRLIEKVHALGNKIYLHTSDQKEAEAMDDLLWSFKPESFIPHCLTEQEEAADAPVLIGCNQAPSHTTDVMINLSREVPGFHRQFARVAEVVYDDPDEKQLRREHWKHYEQLGCEIKSHEI